MKCVRTHMHTCTRTQAHDNTHTLRIRAATRPGGIWIAAILFPTTASVRVAECRACMRVTCVCENYMHTIHLTHTHTRTLIHHTGVRLTKHSHSAIHNSNQPNATRVRRNRATLPWLPRAFMPQFRRTASARPPLADHLAPAAPQ